MPLTTCVYVLVKVIGGNPTKELLKYIDEESLPVFLGGKSDGADPFDVESIKKDDLPQYLDRVVHGGEIPKRYYLKERL